MLQLGTFPKGTPILPNIPKGLQGWAIAESISVYVSETNGLFMALFWDGRGRERQGLWHTIVGNCKKSLAG